MDFNETIFIKNELEIKIFDLTTENNSLRTKVYELNHEIEELGEKSKMNPHFKNLNTNLSTSHYHHTHANEAAGYEQLRLDYEHLER